MKRNAAILNLCLGLIVLFYVVVVVRCAWVNDDAYITLRTVDNFVNGRGLVWNTIERVQTYTHPLWMLILSGVYRFTREAYYSTIVVSALISLAVALMFALRTAPSRQAAIFGVLLMTCSKAYVDYSTSGLENPATHLLLVLFFTLYLRDRRTLSDLFLLSLLAGLAAFNRMDTVLLYVPALLWRFVQMRGVKAVGAVLAGFVPFIAWEMFAAMYYGFLFPNTAYAKLNNAIPWFTLCNQGVRFLLVSAYLDPVLPVTMALSFWYVLRRRRPEEWALAAGLLLYLCYVIWIGGDFMAGRFLTAIFLGSVVLLARAYDRIRKPVAVCAAVVIALSIARPYTPVRSGAFYGGKGHEHLFVHRYILDERAGYQPTAGLLARRGKEVWPNFKSRADAEQIRADGLMVTVKPNVGFFGYTLGPDFHIIDPLALTDPLLARLPPYEKPRVRIGHFDRRIPEGYKESLEKGENLLADQDLARYYDVLCQITRGPVLSGARLREIWRWHRGVYDDLVDVEYYSRPENPR